MRPALDVLRLFLHVGSATIWLGGMVTVAGLTPTLRSLDAPGDSSARVVAAFGRFAWPAYGLLVLTGVWNILELPAMSQLGISYQIALSLKILLAVASGFGAFIAQAPHAPKRAVPAAQALATLSAAGALLIGVGLLS
ncbi:MAG: hypothetical protein R2754_05070 [Microthrixaceae bacterium]